MADFSDLKDIVGAMPQETPAAASAVESPAVEPEPRQPVLDALGRAYATGRRKRARARVWLKPGTGAVVVNGQDQAVYFGRQTHRLIFNQPFFLSGRVGAYDVMATVKGGGSSGQAGALRHGISRALEAYDPTLRPRAEGRRSPHPGRPGRGAQEGRPPQGPPRQAVGQALDSGPYAHSKGHKTRGEKSDGALLGLLRAQPPQGPGRSLWAIQAKART
jgi:small subunit ribosomal protein S9